MVAFFSILVAVALLGVTVYGLHRYQTMEVEYTVDRSMPLPPLKSDVDTRGDGNTATTTTKNEETAGKRRPPGKSKAYRGGKTTQAWLGEVNALKVEGQLQAALNRCQQEFPLWGAYNQACIILRSQLKQVPGASEQERVLLEQLYSLAATAELLHDKSGDSEPLTLGQMKKLDLQQLASLQHPYDDVGYAHLRLIRKSDIRLMQSRWGRPQQHVPPRQYHAQWWRNYIA